MTPSVTLSTEIGPVTVFYELTPAERTTYFHEGHPGSFDVVRVMYGETDITDSVIDAGQLESIREWAESIHDQRCADARREAEEARAA